MLLNELKEDFQRPLYRELAAGEHLQWWAQPDCDAITRSLLIYTTTWMSGLFLMSVSMLIDSTSATHNLLYGLVFILVIVATVGVFELIFVPRRMARTVYIVTSQRALVMCVTKKLNAVDDPEKRILREDNSTAASFYFSSLPAHILLFFAAIDVVHALSHHFDWYLAIGFGLVLAGWTRPWIGEMRLPMAKFRDGAKVLYGIDDLFVSLEWIPRSSIRQVKIRQLGKDTSNIFVISEGHGCLRFRAVNGADKKTSLLDCLGPPDRKV